MIAALLSVLACASGKDALIEDTSYPGFPRIEAGDARCGLDQAFVVEARTRGWTEQGVVQIWGEDTDVGGVPDVEAPVRTTGFLADETCDFVEADFAEADFSGEATTCDTDDFAAHFTALVRLTYEQGCAGELAIGLHAAGILDGSLLVTDPTGVDEKCPAPYTEEWKADEHPLFDTVTSPLPTCAR
jgi:hypothetical protein